MSREENSSGKRIRLLPEDVFNRIAAGEVVERPASVLKELIENSLDAGASSIEATVSGAGRREICVTDDGAGMSREDLLLAFQRHATSKVSCVEDLHAIRTLGFRGEALAAIAAVAHVEVTSRLKGDLAGQRLRLSGGKIMSSEEVGAPAGTTLIVRDLFFNTPARKKFLKSSGVENGHLINVFKRYALAYTEVRWSLNLDNRNVFRLPCEPLQNRLLAIFSEELKDLTFATRAERDNLRLTGFIGAPELARRSRGDQYLFVNQRWVQNRLIAHAVMSAFGPLLEAGKYPFYVLFLELPHAEVDVNVHPAKTEVKFRAEGEIYNFIAHGVREALRQAGIFAAPGMPLRTGEKLDESTGEITPPQRADHIEKPSFTYADKRPFVPWRRPELMKGKPASEGAYRLAFAQREESTEAGETASQDQAGQLDGERTQVYQIHRRFIITEIKGGLAIIDQHAAHERVLYERALKILSGEGHPSQQLLFPRIMELDAENAERLRAVLDDLQALGIVIREFGERSFVLEALPAGIRNGADQELVLEILDELKERRGAQLSSREEVAAAFACRAAIKFGQALSLQEMNALIDQLFATQSPFHCPHGRPTLLRLTLEELERRFGRI